MHLIGSNSAKTKKTDFVGSLKCNHPIKCSNDLIGSNSAMKKNKQIGSLSLNQTGWLASAFRVLMLLAENSQLPTPNS